MFSGLREIVPQLARGIGERPRRPAGALCFGCLLFVLSACSSEGHSILQLESARSDPVAHILFLAGRDSHTPWSHEHRSGSELLATALHQRNPDYRIEVVYGGWPADNTVFTNVDSVVFYADGGEGHMVNEHRDTLRALLQRRVGVVALHYAVEVPRDTASAELMLDAIGGYFETDWSVNPHWDADFTALADHPITRGVSPFLLRDEWYFNMRFTPRMRGVEPILVAVPPLSTMSRGDGPHSGNPAVRAMVADGVPQVVAWAFNRPDGGRGFGYTGGHFHANWDNAAARNIVLNAIEWTVEEKTPRQ